MHYVNNADPVPTLTGLGGNADPLAFLKDAGKGAVVHRFTDGNLNPISNHMLDTLYMKHRVSFDEARAGRFQASAQGRAPRRCTAPRPEPQNEAVAVTEPEAGVVTTLLAPPCHTVAVLGATLMHFHSTRVDAGSDTSLFQVG